MDWSDEDDVDEDPFEDISLLSSDDEEEVS
jgi:hypothetical protein